MRFSFVLAMLMSCCIAHGSPLDKLPIANAGEMALALSRPIAACIVREDTSHPVFKGCVDWHSAVHASWALTAYTRFGADYRYAALMSELPEPGLLEAEARHLGAEPVFEMPYGRAWFLMLATEYDATFDDRLINMADEVAESIVDFYSTRAPVPLATAYENSAWALVNLLRYARYRQRADWVAFVEGSVNAHFLQGTCTVTADQGFMAVCTTWAWLVSEVLPKKKFIDWQKDFSASFIDDLVPITHPQTDHRHGLNFSRCWGLWALYRATGDQHYKSLYLDHFNATYHEPGAWEGDYLRVGHWVAQFGMYALLFPQLPSANINSNR